MDDPSIRIHPLRKGSAGWCYAAIGIILWDALAAENEQLTHAFRRGLKTRKILVGGTWIYLTGHLFGAIPAQYDLIHLVATAASQRRTNGSQSNLRQL